MFLNALGSVVLAFVMVLQAFSAPVRREDFTFRIPPQRIPLNIQNQPLSVVASGLISVGTRGHDQYLLKLRLDADLSDLQQNVTGVLQSQLDKNDPCGDRIAIEHATLMPDGTAARSVVQLHYERYACVRAFGKRRPTRLVGGNGVIELKFTPTVQNGKVLQLTPEVEFIQADGSLGELLRTGPIAQMVREKITKALLSSLQKGTDRHLTLPPAVQNIATIDKAQFQDEGSRRLGIVLAGEVAISPQQIELLKSQLKQHMASR